MEFTAQQLANVLNGTIEGNSQAKVKGFSKIENGKPGSISFFANPKYEKYVYTSKASILLVNNDFKPKQKVEATMIRVENAYAALAQLLQYYADQQKQYVRHRGRCRIACSAKLGKKVYVGDFVSIAPKCNIGSYTKILNNVTIGEKVSIGSHCIIYPGVTIFPGTVIGDRVILHSGCVIGDDGFGNVPQKDGSWKKIEHLGNVIIGNDVEIGSNTTIDRAPMESTIIQDGARIDNLCQIAHNVVVGKNTAIAALSGVAGSTILGENCILAGQTGIVGHLKLADRTTVCAKSGVIGSVRVPGQTIMGMPAINHKTYLRAYSKFKQAVEE